MLDRLAKEHSLLVTMEENVQRAVLEAQCLIICTDTIRRFGC